MLRSLPQRGISGRGTTVAAVSFASASGALLPPQATDEPFAILIASNPAPCRFTSEMRFEAKLFANDIPARKPRTNAAAILVAVILAAIRLCHRRPQHRDDAAVLGVGRIVVFEADTC